MKKLLFVTLILSCVNGFSQSWWNSKKVKGNGNITTVTRSIKSFDKVHVGGFFDVELVDGREGNVTIKGEENIIPYIITEVRDGSLKIKVKDHVNIKTYKKLTVTVPFNSISSASLGGSGNIFIKKTISSENASFSIGGSGNIKATVDTNSVKSSIGGSGNIYLKGKTNTLKSSIGGSGNLIAYDLNCKELKASLAGSGNIKASVSYKIKASLVGSGNIFYKGNPELVDTNAIGSGNIIKK